jgi:hypothetical protein
MWTIETGHPSAKALREARRRLMAEPRPDRVPYETVDLRRLIEAAPEPPKDDR